MSQSVRAHLMLFGVVAVWGASLVLVKDAINDVSPLLFNLIRMCLAFLFLAVIYRRHWRHLTRRAWIGGAVVGLFLATGYQLQTAGLRLTSPSKSGFITGFTVVLVPLLAAFPALRPLGTHAPRWNAWLGAGLAFSGIVLLSTPAEGDFSLSTHLSTVLRSVNLGDLLTLACAFAFAFHIIAQDRITSGSANPLRIQPPLPFQQLALLQIGFCALVMGLTSPWLERPYVHLSGRVLFALAVTSLLATAAAFSIQSWVQQFLSPTRLVLIFAFEPVFAWLTSLAVLHQGLSGRASLGALLILAGIGVAEGVRPLP